MRHHWVMLRLDSRQLLISTSIWNWVLHIINQIMNCLVTILARCDNRESVLSRLSSTSSRPRLFVPSALRSQEFGSDLRSDGECSSISRLLLGQVIGASRGSRVQDLL